jgi:hypothetical protein
MTFKTTFFHTNTAIATVQACATQLLDTAVKRVRDEDLDSCRDTEDLLRLLDFACRKTCGERLDARIYAILAETGVEQPDDPAEALSLVDGMRLHAAIAAGHRLAALREAAVPTSLDQVLPRVVAGTQSAREDCVPFSDPAGMIAEGKANADGTIALSAPTFDQTMIMVLLHSIRRHEMHT